MTQTTRLRSLLIAPLIQQNPVTLQVLGLCSALAVTTSLDTAFTMSAAQAVVLVLSAGIVSTIRCAIPENIRLIIQVLIVASLVTVIDQFLKAFLFDISQRLSVYVFLITTNCIVLGRTESFARQNPPIPSMVDALGHSLGYSLVLVMVGTIRELFGKGSLLGYQILPTTDQGGWFTPLSLMLLAPSAFFILGGLVWAIRSVRREQVEAPDFSPSPRNDTVSG